MILSDKTLSRFLIAGGLIRVAALIGIFALQVASPNAALRWPLSIATLAIFAVGIAAEFVLRREQRHRWRTQDERIESLPTDVRKRSVDRDRRER